MPIPFSFIHAADLHLGCAFKGVHQSNPQVAAVLREATYRSFERILQHAIDSKVDFVLFAGDIYDRNENSLQPQLRFRDGLAKLHHAGIRTCVIHGNHDPLDGSAENLTWPESCHRFPVTTSEACVISKDGTEIAAICGMSYRRRDVSDNLAARYKHRHNHLFTIGLLHSNCGGNNIHGNYAPSSLEELRGYDFNYWALGHIHKPAVLSATAPFVVYAGTPQGLNPKETGLHGFYQVDVEADRSATLQFVPACEVVWRIETIDATAWRNHDDAISALENRLTELGNENEGRSLLLRLTITGRSALHAWLRKEETQRDLLQRLRELGEGVPFVWTDRLDVATLAEIDLESRRRGDDIVGEILRQADVLSTSPEGLAEAETLVNGLYRHARAQNFLEAMDNARLAVLMQRAAVLAVDKLSEGEEL